jgi:anthranilate 1,2-dioxygenase small subunit
MGDLALASNTLILSVMALQAEYAGLIDDDRLEDWPQLFVEDCVYKVISRENADRGMDIATIYCSSRAMLVDRAGCRSQDDHQLSGWRS